MPAPKQTEDLVGDIYNRIKDISIGNEDHISVVLALVAIKILNNKYKPDVSPENNRLIIENYPDATIQDIRQRGLSEAGLNTAIAIFNHASKIAIDYSPLTNIKSDQDLDFEDESKVEGSGDIVTKAYSDIKKSGLTSTGTVASLVLNTVIEAKKDGVTHPKIIRVLIEAIGFALESGRSKVSEKDIKEKILHELCERMGISKKEAEKYYEAARRNKN
ncbi:hypothetical protein [Pseudomonas putida]|uniref:Uncharacterized protein n=1 Tax=Pseudomonas putida TaxID=303 RepID=A0A8I1EBB1_PSEPU|nr:hypothetical protein [Pseudomonas putida]MBI6882356.1 hypothetical protein [Pseudomonas putida]